MALSTKPKAGSKPEDYNEPFGAYIGWQLVVTASAGMVFSTTWTVLRLWTRQHISRALGPDDFLILAAWISATTLSIGDIVQCRYGTGTHLWELELEDFGVFLQLQMVVGNFYGAALAFAKISILFFYLRVFEKPSFRILVYLTGGFVGCYATAGVLVVVFSCNPVAASWDVSLAALPTTVCVNRPAAYLAQAAFNITSDVFVILLPLYEIWKLQMRLRQRLTLMAIFGVGFAFVASAQSDD
ncbi:hypothetical protein ONS95_002624 [Cadophora gregata]|uniref:uncharacterized protein n=1 Tax=Cadophora gregata TaxID=51156 RepID=UPI0026DA7198|nr:uncharacterized protein ONS95_002624 [Cadophora gregata]KAK0109957.1 hypothetical protein ONS95_002624 [Cadophora gregata]